MFCRFCGRELDDDSSFCPGCGQPVNPTERRPPGRSGRDLGRSGVIGFLAIIGLAVVAVALVFAMGALSFEDDGSVRISDDVTVSGALADGTVTVTDLGYGIEFYYNDFESGQWSYIWRIRGDDEAVKDWNTYSPRLLLDKDDIRPGHYDFGVASAGSSAEGGFTLYGTVEDTFEWRYGGTLHSISVSYEYSEFESASDNIVFQTRGSPEARIDRLTAPSDTVSQLESSLRSEYLRVNGVDAPVDGQDYADFILAFVQVCFDYELDTDLYGYEEYWAFPIETLYLRCGDCEDTAILCAAQYDAAGFDAGVFLVPGHAFTAISLESYEEPPFWGQSVGYHIFTYTCDGKTYLGCETTFDEHVPVGVISRDYTVSDDGTFLYQGEPGTSQDGLYLVGDGSDTMGKMFSMQNGLGGQGVMIAE